MNNIRDVVVLLPGITGSVLANAAGKPVWDPSVRAVWQAVKSLGKSVTGLEMDPSGDPGEIVATKLVSDVVIVPGFYKIHGYREAENYLASLPGLKPGKNLFSFPYDWRLDNRVHAQRLADQALGWLHDWRLSSGAADAQLALIGHSMGGLISRYFLECLGGWQHTRTLITLGTPHRGAPNAIDSLVNGMQKKIGPFGLDLTPMLRSLPSVYQLLPAYPCVETDNSQTQYVAAAAGNGLLPGVDAARAAAARQFHQEIEDACQHNADSDDYRDKGYLTAPLVGIEHPTLQSVHCAGGKVKLQQSRDGIDEGGDGTVPRVSATPFELINQQRETYAAQKHGALQNDSGVRSNLQGILTWSRLNPAKLRGVMPTTLSVDMDDVFAHGEPLAIRVRPSGGNPAIQVTLSPMAGGLPVSDRLQRNRNSGWFEGEFDLAPGLWQVCVEASGAEPVTDIAVMGAADD